MNTTIDWSNDSNATSDEIQTGDQEDRLTVAKYFPILAGELSLSMICLVGLAVIYVLLQEHKTVPGKIVLSLSACLTVSYCLLIIDLSYRKRIPKVPCTFISIVIHITFLATFFWTNVMAYDIMKTMASIRPNLHHTARYRNYSLYAWGMTLLCSVPAIVIDNTSIASPEYRPNFAKARCWLSGTRAFLLYFNGPVGMILAANSVLFIITAVTINRVKSAVSLLKAKPHKQRFRLYVKLVMVMGLVWVTEFIPWATGIYKLYALAGILNSLHGLYMFLIFACKFRIWKQLQALNMSRKVERQQSPSMTTLTTSTSLKSCT